MMAHPWISFFAKIQEYNSATMAAATGKQPERDLQAPIETLHTTKLRLFMLAAEFFDDIRSQNQTIKSDGDISKWLGITPARISQMRKTNHTLTSRQIISYLNKASTRSAKDAIDELVKPIVEMYEIERTLTKSEMKWHVLPASKAHVRNLEIKKHLASSQGIYLLYDSLGRAIYVGKTQKQGLWKEINDAFNRDFSNHSSILVKHPSTGTKFTPAWKSPRQPQICPIHLFDTARYFSAYQVKEAAIGDLEALMIRAFANNLSNKKMEKFGTFRRNLGS